MATKHEMKSRYPASSDIVMKMFADKGFHTRKLEAMGLTKYQILDHSVSADEFSIRIERKVPVQMPGIKKGGETSVTNEERWNLKSKTGRVEVEPAGMPVKMSCVTSLADEGGECVVTYRWDIEAKIPLVGGTLEKFIVSDMESRAADETRAGIALLADYR